MCLIWKELFGFSMEKKIFSLLIAIVGMGFSHTEEWVSVRLDKSYNSHTAAGKELVWSYDQPTDPRAKQNHPLKQAGITQGIYYNIIRKGTLAREFRNANNLHPHNPIIVTANGRTCILFGAKRIMVTLTNQTRLDLTDKTFGLYNTVDVRDSTCSEENATLSLTFGDVGSIIGLTIRFILIKSYYKLSVQNWFKLQSVQIISNNSVQATFNAMRIFAPISNSYHCHHVSSLQKNDALLIPSSEDDSTSPWDITFLDFQIQGFNVEEEQFAYAKDCATYFSPAILMGLAMSLILLLVLAYALHMLIHLKSIDRHYQRKSPSDFPKTKGNYLEEEREPLRGSLRECYELRHQEYCRLPMQQCASVSH
ncbi:hypothetical protein FKM82_000399 [Ascaphus truei]